MNYESRPDRLTKSKAPVFQTNTGVYSFMGVIIGVNIFISSTTKYVVRRVKRGGF